jgi:DNA-binding NtrC family response regulator
MITGGANEFVTKPFDVDRLLEILDEFCPDPNGSWNRGSRAVATAAPGGSGDREVDR